MVPFGAKGGDSPPFSDNPENGLQPFFVLQRGLSQRSERKCKSKSKDLPNSPTRNVVKPDGQLQKGYSEDGLELRMEAFNFVWSKIDTSIKDVLRHVNITVFNEVHQWVHDSFQAVKSYGKPGFIEATRLYPVVTDAAFKQLFTGLVLTKNMEFVDDLLTFEELCLHLKANACHVAKLSSVDFSAKNGIGGCLKSFFRQFLMVTVDAPVMPVLASWYNEHGDYDKPVVIVVEDMERCCGSILSDFILMLSEWVIKIPVILVFGVATTLDAPRNILSSEAFQRLQPYKFILGSPAEIMDAIVEAVFLKPCSLFSISHKVALFLRNYFVKQDGTLTSFIRALKIACAQHFFTEPLSFLLRDLDIQEDCQSIWNENQALRDGVFNFELSSGRRIIEPATEKGFGLTKLKRLHKCWSAVVMCLFETGRSQKIQLFDLYCEALDPDPQKLRTSNNHMTSERGCGKSSPSNGCPPAQRINSFKSASISQAVCKVRDLPAAMLPELLKRWGKFTEDIPEISEKVKELESMVKAKSARSLRRDSADITLRQSSRGCCDVPKDVKVLNEKAVRLIEWMLRDFMQPIESLPFHEIFCFKDVGKLQTALLGDPRRTIQDDLLEFHKYLHCSCCSRRGNKLLPSLHDTSMLYILAQEHGDVINLHDWYQSFRVTVMRPSTKGKSRAKQSPLPKKRKESDDSRNHGEAALQAQFCRGVTELQITGLLRMPSKRRPDYVHRVAFGL